MHPILKKSTAALLIAATLGGCSATFPRQSMEPTTVTRNDTTVQTVVDGGNETTMDLDAGFNAEDVFMLRPVEEAGVVPDRLVKPIHVTESGIYDALTLIARDAGLSLNIEGGPKTSERFGAAAVFDLKGSLRDVLETLADSMGIFYSVRNNTLFLQQEQQFIVELPPALSEDNAAGLANTLQHLGAKDPYVDRLNRSLVFKTNRKALSRIESYLQKVRENRALIVYSIDIFQVDLKDNSNIGISWNKLAYNRNGLPASAPTQTAAASGITSGTTGAQQTAAAAVGTAVGTTVSATANALGMNLILSSSKLTIDSLIDFLQTQGNVKAISRPRLSVITGSKGALRVGQSTTYVSKIGTNFSTSLNQVTTETRDLRTGLELALYGDYSDNTVYTKLKMSLSEIVRFNKFTALGIDLVLPDAADREIENVIRSRPGDLVLLGGITTDRETRNDNRGVSENSVTKEVVRSELVLALRSKVVFFKGKKQSAQAPAAVGVVTPTRAAGG
ncbi:type II and III secretion system protein [Noviherbaspirillum suwonense]|uniref:Type II and III secretion system protein n=2 Tax=Noviherbaspirillum suwonense TaxID=1224511 RepID=A0ABY1QJ69_9BURK|nr:type II and III secretion system protein [Noviherbaspirillum suwonense]